MPDSNQTSKNANHFEGTLIKNLYVGNQMHTCKAKKTGEIFFQSLKCTSFAVLGEYAKQLFGVFPLLVDPEQKYSRSLLSRPDGLD